MPYSIRLPDGRVIGNIPDDVDPYDAKQQIDQAFPGLLKAEKPEEPEESGVFRQSLDVPVQVGKGVATGVRMLSDVFGAANPVSKAISGVEDYMDSLLSAQARNDQEEIARIMADAEDKGVSEKVLAGVKAFATAPVDIMSQALGTAVPTIAGGLYGNIAKLGALGVRGIQAGIGALTGAGVVKGAIYDAVEDALIEAGESPETAREKASEAQAYAGENWGSILAGTALGAVAGSTGLEKTIVERFAAKKSAEEAAKGLARRAIEGGVKEFTPEFLQAAQEQVAANLALQKEGFDVDTYRGAIEQGTLEGLAGFGLGAGFGAIGRRREPEAPSITAPEAGAVSSQTYNIIGSDGNLATVTVTENQFGEIIATDSFGEEVDLTNFVSRGVPVEQAVKAAFSFEEAPEPEPVAVEPVAEPKGPELITPQMPDIPPRQVPTSYLPDREPAVEAPPEPPKLLGYSPTAGQEPMYVFSDGSVAIGEEAAFNRRYEPQKLSPEELSAIAPDLEGVEFKPVKQPPLPITPEETAALKEQKELLKLEDKRLRELERKYASLSRAPAKGEDLRKFLYKKLDQRSVTQLGTDPQFEKNYLPFKGKEGKSLEYFIENGLLNPWLPEEMRIDYRTDSREVMLEKEKAGYDHIVDKLRDEDFFTEDAKNELKRIYDEITATLEYIEREAGFENLRDIVAEIYEEEIATGFEPSESEIAAAAATEDLGKLRIERAQREGVTPEERAIADRERELFTLQPQVPEKVGAPTADMFGARGLTEAKPKTVERKAPAAQMSLFADNKSRVENKSTGGPQDVSIEEAKKVEKAIEGKTALQVAKWISYNDPDPSRRLIAKRVINRMEKMMDAGIKFDFSVVHIGDKIPAQLNRSRGLNLVSIDKATGKLESVKSWVNGSDVTGRVGTTYETVLHELTHSVTSAANFLGRTKMMQGTNAAALSERLVNLSNAVIRHYNNNVKEFKAGRKKLTAFEQRIYDGANALDNSDEVLAWGLTSKEMQDYLESIPYKGKNLWSEFVTAVRKYLGLTEPQETALSELLSVADEMLAAPLIETGKATEAKAPMTEQIKLFSAQITGMSNAQKGDTAMKIVDALGRGIEPPKTNKQKINEFIFDDKGNVKITPEAVKKTATKFIDRVETWAFSSDAALNNVIRREISDTTKSQQEKIGTLLSISSSQSVHADAVASLFNRYGGIKYNPEIYKYEAVDRDANFVSLAKKIDSLAKKYNMTNEQAQRVAHVAFEAKRLRSLQEYNEKVDSDIEGLRAKIRKAKAEKDEKVSLSLQREVRRRLKDYKFIHMSDDEIAAGLRLIDLMPKELNEIVDTWNQIRLSSARELVDSGLWSMDEAITLLSNMDYVPFYREEQLEEGKGPKEFLRGLQVQAKEKKLKGSKQAVNDVFDNMVRWTQYAVKRSVMNRLALAKIDAAVDVGIAKQVDERTKDTVRVWRDGMPEFYKLDDPMFMEAFAGLESVSIPTWKWAAKVSNFLRQSVVLNPLFSLSQVPQDAFAAIYTSGLKPRFALTIPARAVKEFVLTLAKQSQTHKKLERFAAVGIKDYSAAIARKDVEVMAGLKAPPGVVGKVKNFLEHVSMASDNAVRQAVYEASISQGLSRGEALEKSFQLINFKNKGSSKFLQMLGQVVPFFNAYLAAQHVALKVVSGVGISPSERKEALKTLIYTTAAVSTLALIYSAAMDDDDEYKNTPSIIRDRLLMIPGLKMSIPLRPDIFAIPKILTEHTYMLMTNQGSEDGRKFRDSIKAALGNAFLGPTPVPQVVKPVAEVLLNRDFFQGRPLIGTYQKGLETERQFNDSTSELGKALGSTGMISPIAADHLIRGMFGSVGGLTLLITNQLIHNDPSSPRPEMTTREVLAALPGTSGFVRREYETGIKNDFYVLRDEVSKAVNTLNDLKARSPHEIEKFLADEKNINRIGLQKATNKITQDLSKIRREISRIRNSTDMTAKEKQQAIKELQEIEKEMLSGIDIKELRSIAQL